MTKNDGESISAKEIKNNIKKLLLMKILINLLMIKVLQSVKVKGLQYSQKNCGQIQRAMGFPVARLRKNNGLVKVDRILNIANIFKSIGHPVRLQILRVIHEHETLSVKIFKNY